MAKTITQRVLFRNISPKKLYDMFLNAKHHGAITGGAAKITPRSGTAFSVHNGYVTGKNLQLVDGRLIVQSWFGSDWSKGETDSTFILYFQRAGKDTVIYMTHANIPDEHVEAIRKGWIAYYWKPWKQYLASK
ncbi:MAG: SRPBCC domain-containing protein [Cyclobacteriaceae bacterium]|jgi:activator of HSP90 ATPase|nr:SRPBCC domain-containing protein [Cyclobacteriaceae bacterium]MDH4297610.1 SRPBCC domain-containing protein [Cyclobacteriaceae bacterium]MDH5250785.1 SRPBCC domain-containing protein [Cyclobacteriaceae bacterium]